MCTMRWGVAIWGRNEASGSGFPDMPRCFFNLVDNGRTIMTLGAEFDYTQDVRGPLRDAATSVG
jgi:hypothetical protein